MILKDIGIIVYIELPDGYPWTPPIVSFADPSNETDLNSCFVDVWQPSLFMNDVYDILEGKISKV